MVSEGACDPGCICKGNWRAIVKECEHLIGKEFISEGGVRYRFFGVVHTEDDYYYGMSSTDQGLMLLSCVGSLEAHGFRVAQ